MASIAATVLAWVGLVLLARIAWIDFRTMRIANRDVLVLFAASLALWAAHTGGRDWWDVAAGLFLFVLGFVFWMLRLMGGGDAKLFLPMGILIGWDQLIVFGLALLPASLLSLAVLYGLRTYLPATSPFAMRSQEIAQKRGIPYGVPLFLAASLALLPRLGVL